MLLPGYSVVFSLVLSMVFPAAVSPLQNALLPAGIQARQILDLWHLTLAICTLVFVAILAAFIYAIWRAPRSNELSAPDTSSLHASEPGPRRAVIVAVLVSALLLLVLLVADVMTDRALARMPLGNGIHIELTGHRWWWEARYSADPASQMFTTANELHIPVGTPVVISLKASDVIHSFWVPNLHGKKDMIPGRTATITLRADKPGIYRGQCAEFCGMQHTKMALLVIAQPPAEYEAWVAHQRKPAPKPTSEIALYGQRVFTRTSCAVCHTIQGTDARGLLGPDLTHLAGRRMIAAGTLPNTRGHRAAWISDPQQIKPGANMPPSKLSGEELQALLAYLETLQ